MTRTNDPFFHQGEADCQREAGVDTAAFEHLIAKYLPLTITANDVAFIHGRAFSVAATLDAAARPWLSPLFGPVGLFRIQDASTVIVNANRVAGDPLMENIKETGELGILFLNLEKRRRAKSMGKAAIGPDGSIIMRLTRYFALCPKYIFRRSHLPSATQEAAPREQPATRQGLTDRDKQQLESADTIFLGSFNREHGADPTLRGGPPGFVSVIDSRTVLIPDYLGNGMFNTLGNLRMDGRLALLSLDFASGRVLHLTGQATVEAPLAQDALSQRSVVLRVDEVRETWPDIGTWQDIEAFPHAPGLKNPLTPMLDD